MSTSPVDRLNARVHGDGARTVVLGNGFGTQQSAWKPQVAALKAAGWRVVTYDPAGATPHTLPAYQPERHATLFGFAEDLVSLMRAMDIRGAAYVGHSAGGMVGVLAANGEPGLFSCLSLIGASARYVDDPVVDYRGGFSREQIDGLLAAMRGDYAAWANGFAPLVVGNPDRPHLAVEFTRSLLGLRPDIASAVLETIFLSDHRQDAARLALPLQVLQTARDPAVPEAAARWLAEVARAADFRIVEAEGHFPHISDPERVTAALLKFLEGACRARI